MVGSCWCWTPSPGPETKAGVIVDWLKTDHDLGRGHAMALVHAIKKGPKIDSKHVGSNGTHRDESDTLWLDGMRIGRDSSTGRRAPETRLC